MTTLTVEVQGMCENALNKLVEIGYAKTKAEAIRQAIIHLGMELQLIGQKQNKEDEWNKYALKKALEDWDDADKLFKF